MKLRAHALLLSLVIAVIVAVISSSLILLAYYSRVFQKVHASKGNLVDDLESGINLFLTSSDIDSEIQLYKDSDKKVYLNEIQWGFYKIVEVSASNTKDTLNKFFYIGYPFNEEKQALYLKDANRPLGICGNTRLVGNVKVPKAGLKRTYIEGANYTGSKLVYGGTQYSSNKLPDPDFVYDFFEGIFEKTVQALDSMSVYNSFSTETKYLQYSSSISSAKGNLVFVDSRRIDLYKDQAFEDVILCAPKVYIHKGFKGNIQICASDTIVLDEDVFLDYPSGICLIKRVSEEPFQSYVKIGNRSRLAGIVFHVYDNYDRYETLTSLASNSLVEGSIYNKGYTELKGAVHGKVITEKFYLKTASSIYENNLLNATIDATECSKYIAMPYFSSGSTNKEIIKWLY